MSTSQQQSAGLASIAIMATITIRRIPDDVLARLRVQAAHNGVSMEEEARRLIGKGVGSDGPRLGSLAIELFGGIGVELEIAPREIAEPPAFE